jgi:gliding-associated putative ABC transporter substrate-binding component GldG
MVSRLMKSKFWWCLLIVGILAVNWIASLIHFRADLTAENRFTLSPATRKLIRSIPDEVTVDVFLAGDMPAEFRNLRNATEELLQEFRENNNANLVIHFGKPGAGMEEGARQTYLGYLDSIGLHPTNVKVQTRQGESQEERLVYPGALVSYRGRSIPVDLLQGQDMTGQFTSGAQTLNTAAALLEYKFASTIQKLTEKEPAVVGYLTGNGEPLSYNVYDLIERTIKPSYGFGFVPIDSVPVLPLDFDALFLVKPSRPFTDRQKLKLDQYVMHGGKLIWLIDNLYAEMDSLMRNQSDFIAYDRGLNLDDQLFRYGVRINRDLLQDLQCDKLPLAVGNYGDKPQMQLLPWFYFPLLTPANNHPVSKNLNSVLSIFPNSLDTVEAEGISKTVLLSGSDNSRLLSTPAIVSLNSVRTEEDLKTFTRKRVPVAMLLEGRFRSFFANRIAPALADSLSALYKQPYLPSAEISNKMIVISDADIVANVVTQNEGPLAMGTNQFTKVQYANRDFIVNCIEYLVNPSGILNSRSKSYVLRMLDPAKVDSEKTTWQMLTVGVPVLLILAFAFVYQLIRNRKYTS